jgi:hypothetical protein
VPAQEGRGRPARSGSWGTSPHGWQRRRSADPALRSAPLFPKVDARTLLRALTEPFVVDGQAAGAVGPGMTALDQPAMLSEPVASLDAASGDSRPDPTLPALPPPPAAHRRDRVQRRGHQRAVVAAGAGQDEAERRATRIGDEVALDARLAPVRRGRAGGRPPFFAGTLALSTLARLQSISPAAGRRSSCT